MTTIDHNFTDAAEVAQPFNDADLLGVETAGYVDLLDKPATLMTGEMWGAKDRRNTQDGEWNSVTMPWRAWIAGGPKEKNTPAWGFSRHPIGKDKAGVCIVLGASIGRARTAKAMEMMYAMALDIDAGFPLNNMLDRLEELGLFCLVYTSHSHGKRGLQLKHDEVIRKLGIKPGDLDLDAVKRYLREHDKNRYEESFVDSITIKALKKQVAAGVVIDLETPPLDKYRLIFPLAESVKLIDLADTHSAALEVWEDKITGLAREVLDVHFDTSCTDPSRLFYTARHPKDAEDWYCAIVRGDPLRFEDVPEVKKSAYTGERKRAGLNPFEIAGGAADGDRPPECITPSGASLNDWHRQAKDRFNMADMLEDHCPDKIRRAGGEAMGHVHIECPFEHEHSSEGGTATMAINAIDSANGFWTIFCHHDACQGRHKLEFLEEALRQGWFSEDLISFDSSYMMDAGEEVDEDEEEEEDEDQGGEPASAEVGAQISAADLQKRFRKMIRGSAGKAAKIEAIRDAVKQSGFGKREVSGLWDEEERAQIQKPKGRSTIPAKDLTADFNEQVTYAQKRITAANADAPRIFEYMDSFAVVDERNGRVRLLETQPALFTELAKVTRWEKVIDDKGNSRFVSPPDDVVRFLHNDATFKQTLPEISGGVVTTPFFAADGSLVIEPGYHAGAKVYLAPTPGLTVPRVSGEPTAEEVAEAKRLIIEEVLADFPLGGMTRAQIVSATGEKNAPIAHTIGYMILPFCREMIAGPTPGHVFTKPAPGTGASLLDDMCAMIDAAEPAPAIAPPKGDEMGKTLTSVLKKGPRRVRFDNAHEAIASAELAMAMTAPTYGARILGVSETVDVAVRAVWGFTANNFEASKEFALNNPITPALGSDCGPRRPLSPR